MYSFWLDETATPAKRYYEGRAFVYGEGDDKVQYTKAGATPATFASLKFKEVIIDPRPWDDNYYIVSGPDDDGHYTATPRQLDDSTDADGNVTHGLKWAKKQESWMQCESLLAETDWWITYQTESTEAPADPSICTKMEQYRAYVRYVDLTRAEMIEATTSVDELKALMEAPQEIVIGDDPPITNPEPHLPVFPPSYDYEMAVKIGDGIKPVSYKADLLKTLEGSPYMEQVEIAEAFLAPAPAKTTRKRKS